MCNSYLQMQIQCCPPGHMYSRALIVVDTVQKYLHICYILFLTPHSPHPHCKLTLFHVKLFSSPNMQRRIRDFLPVETIIFYKDFFEKCEESSDKDKVFKLDPVVRALGLIGLCALIQLCIGQSYYECHRLTYHYPHYREQTEHNTLLREKYIKNTDTHPAIFLRLLQF